MNEMQSVVAAPYARRDRPAATGIGRAPVASPSLALPGVQIVLHDDLASTENLWRAFEPTADCTVFQNFDYLVAWQKHIGARAGVAPVPVVVRRDRDVIAIFPLAIERGAIRRLTWLGGALSDYLGPLLAADFARLVAREKFPILWREVLALMQQDSRLRHDLVDLRKMPEFVGGQQNPFATLPAIRHASEGHVTTLRGDWESFYRSRRSAKARRQDRAKLKRLTEAGEVRMISPEYGKIPDTIATLFEQKRRTFARKGIPDKFQQPGHREFFLDLALNPRTREMVHTSELRVGSAPAAANFGLQFRGRYSLCLVSYDEDFSRDSPGAIHLNELMRLAIDRGMREFDFLVGSQRLKREWSDRRIPLLDHIGATTLRGWPVAAVSRGLAHAKRMIKTTPALWEAFVRLRALVGRLKRRRGAETGD
jgi:CelD/BcsL family acetyltransferase involved in cellulose biosynthesis